MPPRIRYEVTGLWIRLCHNEEIRLPFAVPSNGQRGNYIEFMSKNEKCVLASGLVIDEEELLFHKKTKRRPFAVPAQKMIDLLLQTE